MVKPWTINEALNRTMLRAQKAALDEADAGWRSDPEDGRDDLGHAQDAVRGAFCRMMADGRAASFGKVDGGSTASVPIPPEAWHDPVIEWEHSLMTYGPRDGRVSLSTVRVYPLLHLPDLPARLAGLALADAFRRFVLDDPELIAAVDRAAACFPGKYHCHCAEVVDGMFTADERLWPAVLADYDLAVEWMDAIEGRYANTPPVLRRGILDWLANQSDYDRVAFQTIRETEAVVRDRVDRLLAPLRGGAVVAVGHMIGNAAPAAVLSAIWSRPTTRIDFENGELLRASGDGPPQREWCGLTLSLADGKNASPEPPVLAAKAKGGRPEKHAWEEALDRLTVKLLEVGEPETGADLARMMADCFEAMKVSPPADDEIRKWLRAKRPHLWGKVTKGT